MKWRFLKSFRDRKRDREREEREGLEIAKKEPFYFVKFMFDQNIIQKN